MRQALHCLKYKGDVSLGEILARPLIRLLQELGWAVDLVVPVPIGVARRAERGYNQAALLAFPVALGCGLSYQAGALRKVRETLSQVGLGAAQRYENVSGAFQANQRWVIDRSILVVDDVTTSGATMHACTNALLQVGAKQVYGLTLARAGLDFNPAEMWSRARAGVSIF
ncbi:MAG: phosphoribosyltransferase family protein [Chloroflexota bacterium]